MHLDLMLLQKDAGRSASSDIGIDPFTTQDSVMRNVPTPRGRRQARPRPRRTHRHRLSRMEGALRIHREVPILNHNIPRCTLVPVARYVPGHASGYQLILPGDPRPRQWDSQGQVRSGTSPTS